MQVRPLVVTALALFALNAGQPGRAAEDPAPFTGLVIQVEGQEIKPALSVRVLSEDGGVVYGDLKQLSPEATTRLIETGMAAFATNWQDVEQRCGSNPLVVKIVSVKGDDIVISRGDAEQVRLADVKKHFLAGLQVAVFTPPPPAPQSQEQASTITQQDLPADEDQPSAAPSPQVTESPAPAPQSQQSTDPSPEQH